MRAIKPGRVCTIGDSIASKNAKVEVRTGVAMHDRHAREERHAFLLVREPGGAYDRGEVAIQLDRAELSLLRDALTDALRWVK